MVTLRNDAGIYCVKCCTGIMACDIANGEKGCAFLAPGDYSSTFDGPLPVNANSSVVTTGSNTVPLNITTGKPGTTSSSLKMGGSSLVHLLFLAAIFL